MATPPPPLRPFSPSSPHLPFFFSHIFPSSYPLFSFLDSLDLFGSRFVCLFVLFGCLSLSQWWRQ
ncbi:hypothetical protein GBA52_008121 [Prunus armeniaca]|nr:hypothetical protein GBA52_008121 [Prunus armeniaca]